MNIIFGKSFFKALQDTFTFILIIYKSTYQNDLAILINNIFSKSGNKTNMQLSENKETKNTKKQKHFIKHLFKWCILKMLNPSDYL